MLGVILPDAYSPEVSTEINDKIRYAAMLGVEPVTVRQWIRRGKLRYAKKIGRDWLIPDTEDKPQRGFTSVRYLIENGVQIESDEFPLLATCETVFILQEQDNKRKFECYLNNYKTKFRSKIELTRSEVERLEHTIIESGKARGDGNVFIRKKSNKKYTEPHHLVPMAFSDEFEVSLDREENIVSLCSNCHNQIHYGIDADVLIKKLYNERKEALESVGIKITLEHLLSRYDINA